MHDPRQSFFGVLILVYALSGALSGLSGIVDAARFNGGRPNAGMMYKLQVQRLGWVRIFP